jgi:hypothetical protein
MHELVSGLSTLMNGQENAELSCRYDRIDARGSGTAMKQGGRQKATSCHAGRNQNYHVTHLPSRQNPRPSCSRKTNFSCGPQCQLSS